jgi:glutaredoxin
LNVQKDSKAMDRMLEFSKGEREVPVIVENGKVSIGFGGT